MLDSIFGVRKPVIAMLHFPALPGRPRATDHLGINQIVDSVGHDLEALQAARVDGVMFCNEADIPYQLAVGPEIPSTMAAAIGQLHRDIRVPFGVNVLYDPRATIALARATGAMFAREIFTGTFESDLGLIEPRIGDLAGYRAAIGASNVALFDNITPELGSAIGQRSVADRARGAAFLGLDAVLISGPMAGMPISVSDLRAAKDAVPRTPVLANTGVNAETVADILAIADGVIVGTSLKQDGSTWNPVDPARAARFMEKVESTRSLATSIDNRTQVS